jgi:hypothetical protein
MKINIKLNIEKKYAFLIVGVLLMIGTGLFVYAYNSNMGPSVMGHSAGEMDWANGQLPVLHIFGANQGNPNGWETAFNQEWPVGSGKTGNYIRGNTEVTGSLSVSGDVCASGTGTNKCLSSASGLSGILCGASEHGDYGAHALYASCGGIDPYNGCPTGYNKIGIRVVSDINGGVLGAIIYTCAKA